MSAVSIPSVCAPGVMLQVTDGRQAAAGETDRIALHDEYFIEKKLYPNMPHLDIEQGISIREFDEKHTAPIHGFKDAADYYRQCSSIHFIPEIKIPTLILSAQDDPIADPDGVHQVHGLREPLREQRAFRYLRHGLQQGRRKRQKI